MKKVFVVVLVFIGFVIEGNGNPNVLVVQAHPDDETQFAGMLFKIGHDLQGEVFYLFYQF